MRRSFVLPVALGSLLLTSACAYDMASSYAPQGYPPGYDSGMGSGLVTQPGDLFGSQNVASVAAFDAPLAPYGRWVDSQFGRAFRPDAPQGWRPYVNGRWGENRIWISDDPWGWATDHYGRWGYDQRIGWVWVPGTEWAPSWVAFRDDPAQNVSGWAPIPPNVNYSLNLGFGSGWGYDNFASWYGPSWVWVPRSYLYQPGFGGRVLPWGYGANYWGGSRWQYQPGWGGRPRSQPIPAYRPPGGNWQGRPQNGQWNGRPPEGGQWNGRPPQAGQWNGRPRDDDGRPDRGNWNGRAPEGGRPGGDLRNAGQGWQSRGDGRPAMGGLPRTDAPRPVASYETPRAVPAAQPRVEAPRMEQPRYEPPPRMERPAPAPRNERRYEDSGNVRPQ